MYHIECTPDEALLLSFGINKRLITHHSGKSRVINKLKEARDVFAMFDEDPNSYKCSYERNLQLVEKHSTFKLFKDSNRNKIISLNNNLEFWIIDNCKRSGIDLIDFNLPNSPGNLRSIINARLKSLNNLYLELSKQPNSEYSKIEKIINAKN